MKQLARSQERIGQYATRKAACKHKSWLDKNSPSVVRHRVCKATTWRNLQEVACWTVCQVGTK